MSKALEGEHLCLKHQGNHSHYAEENCTVCKQAKRIAELEAEATAEYTMKLVYIKAVTRLEAEAERNVAEIARWKDRTKAESDACLAISRVANAEADVLASYIGHLIGGGSPDEIPARAEKWLEDNL